MDRHSGIKEAKISFCASINGGLIVPLAHFKGVFPTYKRMRDGSRKTYWYHRGTGKRLRGNRVHQNSSADFADAQRSSLDLGTGTFRGLIRDYTLSREFETLLAQSTRLQYRRMLTKAEAHLGDLPLKALDDSRVRKDFLDWREKIAKIRK